MLCYDFYMSMDICIWFITYVGSDVAKKNLWEGGIMLRILKKHFEWICIEEQRFKIALTWKF